MRHAHLHIVIRSSTHAGDSQVTILTAFKHEMFRLSQWSPFIGKTRLATARNYCSILNSLATPQTLAPVAQNLWPCLLLPHCMSWQSLARPYQDRQARSMHRRFPGPSWTSYLYIRLLNEHTTLRLLYFTFPTPVLTLCSIVRVLCTGRILTRVHTHSRSLRPPFAAILYPSGIGKLGATPVRCIPYTLFDDFAPRLNGR
jgi:hypothetical protein